MAPRTTSVPDLVERARAGDPRALARLVSLVEDGAPELREVMALLAPTTGRARVVGLTGPPGVGKSTTTDALVRALRERDERVAVLAVDPSSPFTGGALLGDRVRMQGHATDPGVYIRSMASRGHLGGLSRSTPQVLHVLDAVGVDVALVETVGVGQSEVEVAGLADTVVVLLAPGMGDGIQAAKAGVLEIGDIYVVNKADREGADATAREIRHMLALGEPAGGREGDPWKRPVLKAVASTGEGIDGLVAALDEHRSWGERTGALTERRRRRAAAEIEAVATAELSRAIGHLEHGARLDALAAQLVLGELDAYRAADDLLAVLRAGDVSAPDLSAPDLSGAARPTART